MALEFELSEKQNMLIVKNGEGENIITETVDLNAVPKEGSLLVNEAVSRLYGVIDPVTLYNNLSICADLFEIAYDACDGIKDLHRSVWELRQNMIDTTSQSANKYVNGFLAEIKSVPTFYNAGAKAILSDPINEDRALKAFSMISEKAKKISEGAKDLMHSYEELKSKASDLVGGMIDKRSSDIDDKAKLNARVDELNASLAGLKASQEDLESEIEELTEKYNNLDKKIDKASDRQFWLGITSSIFGALATGFSAYLSSTPGGAANNIGKNVSETVSGGQQSSTLENTQQRLDTVNKKISDSELNIKSFEEEIKKKDEEISKENDEEKRKTLLKDKENLTASLDQEKSSKSALEAQAKSYTEVIQGISAGFSEISAGLNSQSENMANEVSVLMEQSDNIFKQRSELRKEKRELILKIAEYTKEVENSVVSKNSLDLAISALSAGIGAMNYIISVLNDFYAFWVSVHTQTENMSEGEIENYISLYEDDPEELRSVDFYTIVASNAAQWAALKKVLTDYQKAFYDVYEKLNTQLKENEESDPELMWKRAIEKSQGMSALLSQQADALDYGDSNE